MKFAGFLGVTGAVVVLSVCVVMGGLDPNQQPLMKQYGFYKGSPQASVWLELHGDLLCIDTLNEWEDTIVKVLAHFPEKDLYFIFHPFPLPYHHNAFFAAKAGYAVEQVTPGSYLRWMQVIFDHQNSFLEPAANKTEPEVIQMLADLASDNFDVSNEVFYQNYNRDVELMTRAQWKFSASRGVSGTPTYFLNGVRVLSGNWGVQDWIAAIQDLM